MPSTSPVTTRREGGERARLSRRWLRATKSSYESEGSSRPVPTARYASVAPMKTAVADGQPRAEGPRTSTSVPCASSAWSGERSRPQRTRPAPRPAAQRRNAAEARRTRSGARPAAAPPSRRASERGGERRARSRAAQAEAVAEERGGERREGGRAEQAREHDANAGTEDRRGGVARARAASSRLAPPGGAAVRGRQGAPAAGARSCILSSVTSVPGLRGGKRITSRIEAESVKSIVTRSMPIPSPAVGGIPCSSARTKSSS